MELKDNYEQDIMRKIFPEFSFDGNGHKEWYIDTGEDTNHLFFPSCIYNKYLQNSPYCLMAKTHFIHYTSLENACSIIQQNRISLNELNQVNDPLEIIFLKELLNVNKDPWDFYVDGIDNPNGKLKSQEERHKKSIFTFSLCQVDDLNEPDKFEMWRSYAGEGKGAAIVFEIDCKNRNEWYNFHLSNVYYGENEQTKMLEQFLGKHNEFAEAWKIDASNFNYFISTFLANHKSDFYKGENEIRLITKAPSFHISGGIESEFLEHLDFNFYWNKRKSMPRECVYLNLNNNYKYGSYNNLKEANIPSIKVKKILLGYDNSEDVLNGFRLLVNSATNSRNDQRIPVEFSRLKKLLGFI